MRVQLDSKELAVPNKAVTTKKEKDEIELKDFVLSK